MKPGTTEITKTRILHLLFGAGLLVSFFLPWAKWQGTLIRGYDLPGGRFFSVSESQFGLANPFPQLSFSFYIFWLIPVLIILDAVLILLRKRSSWIAGVAGAISLALVTVFFCFGKTLVDLGVGSSPFALLCWPAWLAVISAIGYIVTASRNEWLKKAGWILAGPLFAFLGYLFAERSVWNQTHADTGKSKADYTVSANELLREFSVSDSAANNKYREKILEVNGRIGQAEQLGDSTTTLQFRDSSGSYIVFPFPAESYAEMKDIQPGDSVALRGSCSGSIYSEILGTRSISFKRSTLVKKYTP